MRVIVPVLMRMIMSVVMRVIVHFRPPFSVVKPLFRTADRFSG